VSPRGASPVEGAPGGARPAGGSSALEEPSNAITQDTHEEEEEEEELLFPGFVPTVFRCLSQTTRPRYWCLRLITWPYPLIYASLNHVIGGNPDIFLSVC
jgi:hypothetical protein